VVWVRDDQRRKAADNKATEFADLDAAVTPSNFRDLFLWHYDKIRELCQGYQHRGLVLIALSFRQLVATACLAARPQTINTAIVGRHSEAQLFLDEDPSLSLRHLAVILHPLQAGSDVRFRLVDMRTQTGFVDEQGRRLEALEAEGPVFIGCGRYALFCITTDDDLPWPDDAQAGWACIPERVYLKEQPASPQRWLRRKLGAALGRRQRSAGRRTMVQTLAGPSRARRNLLEQDEPRVGELQVVCEGQVSRIVVGRRAAQEGILVGRYDRCDTDGLELLTEEGISRVHLLLIEIADRIYAVDVASTNGMFVGGEDLPVVPLDCDRVLVLGDDYARLEWKAG